MRLALFILTMALLTACAPVGAGPLATATPLPPPSSPSESLSRLLGPTPTPILRSSVPATVEEPAATLGYGQILSAAFVPGAATLAAVTEAGLLLLRLPDLAITRFVPLPGGELADGRGEHVLRDELMNFEAAELTPGPVWDYNPATGLLAWIALGHAVMVDDPGGGPPRALPPSAGLSPVTRPNALAFSPDGARLAVGYNAGALLVLQTSDLGTLALTGLAPNRAVTALAWGGDTLAAGLDDGTVALWDTTGGRRPRLIRAPWIEPVSALTLSADGVLLGVISASGVAVLRTDGVELLRLPVVGASLALAPDGHRAAVTRRGRVELWDLYP